MKKLLTILFFINSAYAQDRITTDTLISGVWNLQGKVLKIEAKISGNVTIQNAIIEANTYAHIFDTTVNLQNCKAREFSVAWYGAKSTNTDNWRQFQTTSDMCIANGIYNLYVPQGNYTLSREWTLKNIYNGTYVGWSMHVKGDGNIWSNKSQITYTGNYYAIGMQYAKGVIIEGITIMGNYQAPANNGISYYNTPFPVKGYHAGIMIDYASNLNQGGSTGVRINNTWVDGFDVCYDISPNGYTYNADIVILENIRVGNCRIGVRSGQAQEKGNEIRNIVAWGNTQILIQIGKSGKYQGGDYIIRGGNIAGNVVQLFDCQLSGWNTFRVYGLYAESVARIGFFGASTESHQIPITLEGLSIRFALKAQAGSQTLITSQAGRFKISNSNLWYYGTTGEAMSFSGRMTFENCDFGASTFTSPYINNIDYNNSQVTVKRTQ